MQEVSNMPSVDQEKVDILGYDRLDPEYQKLIDGMTTAEKRELDAIA